MQSRLVYAHVRRAADSKWFRTVRHISAREVPPEPSAPRLEAAADDRSSAGVDQGHIRGALATARVELEAEEGERSALEVQADALRSEIAILQADPLYATIQRGLDADLTRRVRANRMFAWVERRARSALGRRSD